MNVLKGQKYRHFKGDVMEIIEVAKHTETLEELVIYKHNNDIWARPYSMFVSKVDKDKYPNVTQEYRFELIEEDND